MGADSVFSCVFLACFEASLVYTVAFISAVKQSESVTRDASILLQILSHAGHPRLVGRRPWLCSSTRLARHSVDLSVHTGPVPLTGLVPPQGACLHFAHLCNKDDSNHTAGRCADGGRAWQECLSHSKPAVCARGTASAVGAPSASRQPAACLAAQHRGWWLSRSAFGQLESFKLYKVLPRAAYMWTCVPVCVCVFVHMVLCGFLGPLRARICVSHAGSS